MRRVIVLSVIFITACAPVASQPSVTPATTNVVPTPPSTTAPVVKTPTPALTANADSSPLISYVKMVDADNGWALAAGQAPPANHVLRTHDGGTTWEDVTPPQLVTVRNHTYWFSGSLSVLDANTAWAIANGGEALIGTVWRTDDGGQSWRPGNPIRIYPPGSEMYINGFDTNLNFIDANHGWLNVRVQGVMAHTIDTWFRTTDGGLTWERVSICRYAADAGCNYLFLDELTGFKNSFDPYISAVNDIETSTIWQIEKTVDGGLTWSNVVLPRPADLISNLFSGENIEPSQVMNFSIGQSFTKFRSSALGVRMDFVAYTANSDFAHPSLNKGYYYISSDNGKTWRYFPFVGDLFFLTDAVGWRFTKHGDNYSLEKTVDNGATWNAVGGELPETGRLQFTDEHTGWILLTKPDYSTSLMRTLDGGQSWQDITANMLDPLRSTDFLTLPSVISSPLSPEPWIARMESGSSLDLETIQMFDAYNGWGTSLNGYIFHTTDGGKVWQDVTPRYGTVNSDHDFFALDASHAWTVITALPICIGPTPSAHCPDYYLSGGPIWYTDDAGKTWKPGGPFPDPERSFESEPVKIQFTNESVGWASWISRGPNDSGPIYHLVKTVDGGGTWESVLTEPYHGEIWFLNEHDGFRTENSHSSVNTMDEFMKGSALPVLEKTTDGGITWERVTLPDFVFSFEGLPQNDLSGFSAFCESPHISFFGARGVSVRYKCWLPNVANFFESYYSPDEGQTWNNWVSLEYMLNMDNQAKFNEWTQGAYEFFLEDGIGWRLYRSRTDSDAQLQHTVDAGKSWETIKTVAWQQAKFDFIDGQEGWAIVVNYDDVALLHTLDGGKTWEEIKPMVDHK